MPLQILDALGRGFFPGVEMALPGTSGHHDLLVAQRQGEDKLEQDFSSDEQRRELEASQAREADATALERSTKNTADNQAVVKAGEGIWDKNTKAWLVQPTGADNDKVTEVDPEIGKTLGIVPGPDGKYKIPSAAVDELIRSKMPAPKTTPTRESDEPLGDRVPKLNEALAARYNILHKGPLPSHYVLPENATHGQLMDIDKLMEAEERAHGSVDTKADSDKWRAIMLAASKENRAEKKDTQTRVLANRLWQPAMDSAERFNVMAKNYEDGVKNKDQQAMLSLLANHIGMTMGAQKGARMTKDVISEAQQSRPWLQGIQAKFDSKTGLLSGVTLTPPQMRQMLDLGHEKFMEDTNKSRNEATYIGEAEEPKRTPNKSTVRYFRSLAHGDMKQAKKLAADAGWSIDE